MKRGRPENGSAEHPCIVCHNDVRQRPQALQCEDCLRWQHRTCGTGVSQAEYRKAVKNKQNISWSCTDCSTPTETTPTTEMFTLTSTTTATTTTTTSATKRVQYSPVGFTV